MTVDKKIEEFKQGLLDLFPGLDMTFLQYGNNVDGKEVWNNIHFNIPPENKNLVRSPYFYKESTVVHFSNIYALNSILQERAVRLYNLHNLNDPREFTFASKVFNLKKDLVDDARDNLYIISFCKREILKNATDEFNLWRLYGQNGKGLAIVFSIANDPENWRDFHISQVVYGADQRQKFVKLLDLIDQLNKTKPHIDLDFGKLCVFHKSKMFAIEKEVRIIFDRRERRSGMGNRTVTFQGQPVFPIIKPDLYKLVENRDNIQYLKIPLFYKGGQNYDPEVPLLKIDQIIIGYNFVDQVSKLTDSLKDLCKEQLGYIPVIKQTRLKNYYWDIDTKKKNK
jgi:hypothetical protein